MSMMLEKMNAARFMQIASTCLARTRYYIDIKTNRQPVTLHNAIGVMRIVGIFITVILVKAKMSYMI